MKNFGKIKNAFYNVFSEGIGSKNDINRQLFRKYIKNTIFDVF